MAYILCADDEPYMQRLFKNILGLRGHTVRLCASGKEALDAFAEETPDLVILDYMMPGMNGLDACREIRRRPDGINVPILIVSGVDAEQSITDCLSLGADDYILKPFNPTEILAKVAVALQKSHERLGMSGFRPGMSFANRYEIVSTIGSGGFSTVFKARDLRQSLDVALKVFEWPPAARNDPKFVSSFLRESYELSKLKHANIVGFHDFGQHGPYYYMVMEFLEGKTLDAVIEAQGVLDEGTAVLIGYEVSRAIQYLHTQNMVHRDIKPTNIMITADGDIKLLDFGLAKQITDTTLRMENEIRATPLFAAPECFQEGVPVDVRSDLYSLGATLYYIVTLTNPFDGDTVMSIVHRHFTVVPASLRTVNPTISAAFSQLVDQMLAKHRDERPGVDDLVRRLGDLLQQHTK